MRLRDSKGRFVKLETVGGTAGLGAAGFTGAGTAGFTGAGTTGLTGAAAVGGNDLNVKIPGFWILSIWLILIFVLSPWLIKLFKPFCYIYKWLGFIQQTQL